MIKLLIAFFAFMGALIIGLFAVETGYISNSVVLTLDSGFKFTKVLVFAMFVFGLALWPGGK